LLLRLKNVTKRFPGVLALDSVCVDVRAGEVHSLLGENGAGKSTLIKILTGAHPPDGGEIYFDGKKIEDLTPRKSMDLGIACIYQELNLIPYMSVVENIFLGREIHGCNGILARGKMLEAAAAILQELGLEIDPKMRIDLLGVGHQQMVEICRAVQSDAKLIIMDEPTSSLSGRETANLFRIIKRLKSKGVTFIFISHRLDEIKAICDTITVLRDGCTVGRLGVKEASIDDMIRLMVGRNIQQKYPKIKAPCGEELLSVEKLSRKNVLHEVSFHVHAGEVLGVAGLVGAGRTELARAITGADPIDSGTIRIAGKEVHIRNPRDSIRAGIAFLTEDRKGQGLILIQSVAFNSTLVCLEKYSHRGFLNLKEIRAAAEQKARDLHLRATGVNQMARNLSGGNQQKLVIAKWLLSKAKIFIFDEPTRGIDVGAKVEVYELINQLVSEGAAVIMISSEMDECMGMADRIIVMHGGQITGELTADEATQEKIMYAASGIVAEEKTGT